MATNPAGFCMICLATAASTCEVQKKTPTNSEYFKPRACPLPEKFTNGYKKDKTGTLYNYSDKAQQEVWLFLKIAESIVLFLEQ